MFVSSFNNLQSYNFSFKGTPQNNVIVAKDLAKHLKQGKKPQEIADIYGVSLRKVYNLLKKFNILTPQKQTQKDAAKKVVPLVLEAHTRKYIMQKTGVTKDVLEAVLKENGLDIKTIRKAKLEEMLKNKVPDEVIAEKLDLQLNTVIVMRERFQREKLKADLKTRNPKLKYLILNLERRGLDTSKINTIEEEFEKLLAQGKSNSEIAEYFNIATNTVSKYLRRMQLKRPQGMAILEPNTAQKVDKLAEQGYSLESIAEMTGLYSMKVSEYLKEKGIHIPELRKQKLQGLINSGATDYEIAKEMHINISSVARARKTLSVRPRTPQKEKMFQKTINLHKKGYSVSEIAEELGLSFSTVKGYVSSY